MPSSVHGPAQAGEPARARRPAPSLRVALRVPCPFLPARAGADSLGQSRSRRLWAARAPASACGRRQGRTALHLACRRGHLDAAAALLQARADVNRVDWEGRVALQLAVECRHADLARLLLSPPHRAAMLLPAVARHPLLLHLLNVAVAAGDAESAAALAAAHDGQALDVNRARPSSDCGDTALHLAVIRGQGKVVSALLRCRDLRPHTPSRDRWVPLHIAVVRGGPDQRHDLVRRLLARAQKEQLEATLADGSTPLILAAGAGPDPDDAMVSMGDEAAEAAAAAAAVAGLLEHGIGALAEASDRQAALDARNAHGYSALYLASARGRLDVVELLLKALASPFRSDRAGWTPLHRAASGAHVDVVELLLKHGADPRAVSMGGDMPWAVVPDCYPALAERLQQAAESVSDAGKGNGLH